jgi:hypothetical protein
MTTSAPTFKKKTKVLRCIAVTNSLENLSADIVRKKVTLQAFDGSPILLSIETEYSEFLVGKYYDMTISERVSSSPASDPPTKEP